MVLLRVMKKENYPEWGVPYFAHPQKKINKVIFLSDFRKKKELKLKPHPMPTIIFLLKLEGLKYFISLDLNMRYYHI